MDELTAPPPRLCSRGVTGRRVMMSYSLAKTWKTAVKKKRPPFTSLKSWKTNAMREKKQKSTDRIMRACTAWIQSEMEGGVNLNTVVTVVLSGEFDFQGQTFIAGRLAVVASIGCHAAVPQI